MNRDCLRAGELQAYCDGQLSAADGQRVAGHLSSCARCSQKLNRIRTTAGNVRDILEVLATDVPVQLPARGVQPLRAILAVAAAVLIAVGLYNLSTRLFPDQLARPDGSARRVVSQDSRSGFVFLPTADPNIPTGHLMIVRMDIGVSDPMLTDFDVRPANRSRTVTADVLMDDAGTAYGFRLAADSGKN